MSSSSPIFTQNPQVNLQAGTVAPPTGLRVSRDEVLFVRVYNAIAGTPLVDIQARLMLPDGTIVQAREFVAPSTDRGAVDRVFPLSEGYLLGLAVSVRNATPRRGQTFVTVALGWGGANTIVIGQVLLSDYVVFGHPLGWPYGPQRHPTEGRGLPRIITGTDPAAGSEIVETVPTNARWRLYGIRFTLVTDATVATRRVTLNVDDGATVGLQLWNANGQTAGLTFLYESHQVGHQAAAVSSREFIPLAAAIDLFQGWRILTSTVNIQAGDNYGAPILYVEEWLEE